MLLDNIQNFINESHLIGGHAFTEEYYISQDEIEALVIEAM